VALLPWWAGIGLAALSYAVLHAIASRPVAVAQPGQIAAVATAGLLRGLAYAGQYVVPIICVGAAALSAWRRRERRELMRGVSANPSAESLNGMTWRQFEKLVSESFRMQGYQVTETGRTGPDGGVDLVLRKDRGTFLVQCKQWKAFKVGVETVRELHGVMAARGATGGFVVTSGRFSRAATQFATGLNIRLIDGPILHALIAKAMPSAASAPAAAAPAPNIERESRPPACPACNRAMSAGSRSAASARVNLSGVARATLPAEGPAPSSAVPVPAAAAECSCRPRLPESHAHEPLDRLGAPRIHLQPTIGPGDALGGPFFNGNSLDQ
jgi:restriction system protein